MKEPKAGQSVSIQHKVADPVINLAVDTKQKDRQLIVFVNTKRGAESQAEKIATKFNSTEALHKLSEDILKALPSPTKQCKRLAHCIKQGAAFHHAGLHSKQRDLIETAFKDKLITCICATPTLAAGVDLPAFRVIIRDLKRYGGPWGMSSIPVLEYEQMAGRAGRPGKDPWGEAICIAKDQAQADHIKEQYIDGEPEEIFSKLAVEPVLRTYVLSLVASEFCPTQSSLFEFFESTFYAHQYGDMGKLKGILERMISKLVDWGFLQGESSTKHDDFVSASDISTASQNDALKATPLGKRVSELYLDPYTAHHIIKALHRAEKKRKHTFAMIHVLASCLEIRPFVKTKSAEFETIDERIAVEEPNLFHLPPSRYTDEYEDFMDTIKTAMLLESWVEELSEDAIMEQFSTRPGELHAKLAIADWLAYASIEIARILKFHTQRSELAKLRMRLKHGAKEELLALLKLKHIGRVRARKLFKNKIKDVSSLQSVDVTTLAQLVGKATAIKLKAQVGQKISAKDVLVKENKRKGQISLQDF